MSTPLKVLKKCTRARGADSGRVNTTPAEAVRGARFAAEMSLGTPIRSPAERSMNIHEKNAVSSRAWRVRTDPGIRRFSFSGAGGRREGVGREAGTGRRVSALALSAKPAKPQTFARSGAAPWGPARCQVQAHTLPAGAARGETPSASRNPNLRKNEVLRHSPQVSGKAGRPRPRLRLGSAPMCSGRHVVVGTSRSVATAGRETGVPRVKEPHL